MVKKKERNEGLRRRGKEEDAVRSSGSVARLRKGEENKFCGGVTGSGGDGVTVIGKAVGRRWRNKSMMGEKHKANNERRLMTAVTAQQHNKGMRQMKVCCNTTSAAALRLFHCCLKDD